MTAPNPMRPSPPSRVLIVCARGRKLTGQVAASLLVRDVLAEAGYRVAMLRLPALERDRAGAGPLLVYLTQMLGAWLLAPFHAWARPRVLINLGQTKAAAIRDLVPLFAPPHRKRKYV